MFVDSHAHIDGPEFDGDRDEVLQRAHDAGVRTILTVGTGDPHSAAFERAVALAAGNERVYAAVGVHPHDARLYDDEAEQKITDLIINNQRVVAWGEIGLDFHYDNSPRNVQVDVFRRQLRAALNLNVPVIIHTREAESETIEALRLESQGKQLPGVMHCFSGTRWLADQAIALGMFISFSGIVTFKKADELRNVARDIPSERLLIETDCPFLAPVPYRGKRNEPAFVTHVARCLGELHGLTADQIGQITSENFSRLFRLPPPAS
ncbi:MAG TPA: TatD family hydrolase [Pyrinomonadaceae bacterium]|nr:TatD family hydrolase [Pyrinomonadaceae bacterium]